jgi:hypothetical protein
MQSDLGPKGETMLIKETDYGTPAPQQPRICGNGTCGCAGGVQQEIHVDTPMVT